MLGRGGAAYIGIENELYALGFHERDAALNYLFVELHVRDTVHQKTAGFVLALVNSYAVPAPVKPVSARKPAWTRPNNGDLFPAAHRRYLRLHVAGFERFFNDIKLVLVDCNSTVSAHWIAAVACFFAKRGANTSCELWKA